MILTLANYRVAINILISLSVCAFAACHTRKPANQTTELKLRQTMTPENASRSQETSDPTCCDDKASLELKQAWTAFTDDGRFRMVRTNELSDSEARARLHYAYAWGDLGYDVDPSKSYHLAVIVVETTRSDNNRFGLVIFSAPRGANGSYRPYWILRNTDLSGAFFSGFSGYLELVINDANGSRNGCDIRWSKKLKTFICGPNSARSVRE